MADWEGTFGEGVSAESVIARINRERRDEDDDWLRETVRRKRAALEDNPLLATPRKLRDAGGSLRLECICRWTGVIDLDTTPDELLDRSVESQHKAERWKCAVCGRQPSTLVCDGNSTVVERHTGYDVIRVNYARRDDEQQ